MHARRSDRLAPRRRPRQARAQATSAAILEAAARVFAAHGYAAGTTNRIAERAGVSVGSLYEYWPNKDAILSALLERHLDEAHGVLAPLVAEARAGRRSLAAIVRGFVTAMVALHAHEPALHRVLFEEAPIPARLRRGLVAIDAAMVDGIAALLREHPDARVADATLAATLVVHTVEALTHRLVLHLGRAADREAWITEVTALVVRYVAGDPRARPVA
ncbi:MAG: TetR family transcriptional regulator [bacterium]|nr:TetR family transcriptional regulator [bacterium]